MVWKSLTTSILLLCFTNVFCKIWPPDVAEQLSDGDTYDFIVVGSGSAGSVVAARLAQRQQKVLLLEAGGEPTLTSRVPGMAMVNFMSDMDWQFVSEYDDRACQSLGNERCRKPRGKVLGGSSAINIMIYVRGNREDYADWNIPSWTYNKMLPYFRRMESLTDYDELTPELKQYHNNNGPLRVSLINASTIQWRDNLLTAYQEIGLTRNWDVNGPSQIGVTITHSTVFAGERQSTAEAYLVPNSSNDNLDVAYNSLVTKVILNKRNIARGVRISIAGKKEITIRAKIEIILCAGTINTPQLLMLSGIGPRSELKKYDIHVHVNNPHVGNNLHDHPMTPIILTANTGIASPTPGNAVQILLNQWLNDRSGLFGTIMACDISAFIDTAHNSSVPDTQYLHLYIARNDSLTSGSLQKVYGFNKKVVKEIQELNNDSEIIVFMSTVLRPISRGSIHLASSDPFDHPLIYGNTLVEPDDYDTYLRGIRLFEKLLTTKTFLKNGAKLAKIKSLDECNGFEFQSDDYWLCYHDHLADTIYHPVGTSSIGRVVDERLRVYGVKKLRIADASVMPLISRGNTNAPTIAIGERAADFIAMDHGFYNVSCFD